MEEYIAVFPFYEAEPTWYKRGYGIPGGGGDGGGGDEGGGGSDDDNTLVGTAIVGIAKAM